MRAVTACFAELQARLCCLTRDSALLGRQLLSVLISRHATTILPLLRLLMPPPLLAIASEHPTVVPRLDDAHCNWRSAVISRKGFVIVKLWRSFEEFRREWRRKLMAQFTRLSCAVYVL